MPDIKLTDDQENVLLWLRDHRDMAILRSLSTPNS